MKAPLVDLGKLHGFKLLLVDRVDAEAISTANSLKAILGAKIGDKTGETKIISHNHR